MSFDSLTFLIFLFSFGFTMLASFIDFRRKKPISTEPFISVIIPTYNDGDTVEESVKSVFDSYSKDKFEIFVVNDKSTDNTLEVLENLKNKYNFTILNNKENLGKAQSLNNAVDHTKGDIILFLDSDTLMSHKALYDMLSSLEDKKVAASTCRYRVKNTGFMARMQEFEYGFMGLVQTSYNLTSTISLWGGCILIKKNALNEVGRFSLNMLTEDVDLALKLGENGWKTRESHYSVSSYVPTSFKVFYKQKIRWGAGFGQCFFAHYKTFLKNPIVIFFNITYVFFTFSFIFLSVKNIIYMDELYRVLSSVREQGNSIITSIGLVQLATGFHFLKTISLYFLYPLFSLPYALVNINSKKEFYKIWLIFPFSIIYMPIYSIISAIGLAKGVKNFYTIKKDQRGW